MIGRKVQHSNKKWFIILDKLLVTFSEHTSITKYLAQGIDDNKIGILNPMDIIAIEKISEGERERYLKEIISYLNLK